MSDVSPVDMVQNRLWSLDRAVKEMGDPVLDLTQELEKIRDEADRLGAMEPKRPVLGRPAWMLD